MSILDQVGQIIHDLQETYDWITNLDNWEHFAGDSGALRRAAREWRSQAATVRNLDVDVDRGLRGSITFGLGGNWYDDAATAFEQYVQRYRQDLTRVADEFDRIAASLEDTAGQVDNFNNTLVWTIAEIGAWIALTIATIWIPVGGEVEAGAAVVEGTRLTMVIQRVVRLVMAMLRLLQLALRSQLVRTFVFNLGALYAARFVEHGIMNPGHDPTKGWGPTDLRQINLDSAFGAVISVGLARVVFVRVAPFTALRGLPSRLFPALSAARGQALVEFLVESPIMGAAGTGLWTAFNHAVFQQTIQKHGWGAYWRDVGFGTLAGAAGGLAAGGVRAGFAAWLPGLSNPDLVELAEFEPGTGPGGVPTADATPWYLQPLPTVAGRVVRTPLELTVPAIAQAAALRGPASVNPPLVGLLPGLGPVPVGSPPQRIVVAGDNLWVIAQGQYGSGTYYTDIARRNHIANPNLIQPGQQLVLPPVDRRHAAYGDGRRWSQVAAANHLHGTQIRAGERLWIPPLAGSGGRSRHG